MFKMKKANAKFEIAATNGLLGTAGVVALALPLTCLGFWGMVAFAVVVPVVVTIGVLSVAVPAAFGEYQN